MIAVFNTACKTLPGKLSVQNTQSADIPQDQNIFFSVLGSVSQVMAQKKGEAAGSGLFKLAQSQSLDVELGSTQTKKEEDLKDNSPLLPLHVLPSQMILPDITPEAAQSTTVPFMETAAIQTAAYLSGHAGESPVVGLTSPKSFEDKAPKADETEFDLLSDIAPIEPDTLEISEKSAFEAYESSSFEQASPSHAQSSTDKTHPNILSDNDLKLPDDSFSVLMQKADSMKVGKSRSGGIDTIRQNDGPKEQFALSHEAPTGKHTAKKDGTSDQTAGFMLGKTGINIDNLQNPAKEQQLESQPIYLQVCSKITEKLKANSTESIKMKLYPEGLGEIQVTLTCKDQTVSLDILTDNETTRKMLESQSGELKAALSIKNFEVSGLSVSTRSESAAFSSDFSFLEKNTAGGGQGQNERQPFYKAADENGRGEKNPVYTRWQDISSGRLNFWA